MWDLNAEERLSRRASEDAGRSLDELQMASIVAFFETVQGEHISGRSDDLGESEHGGSPKCSSKHISR